MDWRRLRRERLFWIGEIHDVGILSEGQKEMD